MTRIRHPSQWHGDFRVPPWSVFGIASGTLVRSSQRPCNGRHGGAPAAAGWGGDCCVGPPGPPPDITAARERSEPLLRCSDVITHVQMSHAPPPEPNTTESADSDCLADLNRRGGGHGQPSTRSGHFIAHRSDHQSPTACGDWWEPPGGGRIRMRVFQQTRSGERSRQLAAVEAGAPESLWPIRHPTVCRMRIRRRPNPA